VELRTLKGAHAGDSAVELQIKMSDDPSEKLTKVIIGVHQERALEAM
jgi:hypothetical protein